ncbi:DUF547 domain-containing protein [Halovivax gelatinilyticus]|uniref:DUF547 domain-containing protein n=1 Tax=Halovivax gelatinilyticus TaxID=2961597 RepID=UPI0020CA2D6D|nr:DUF547 domain-containing protein [Halovivax gelatinilyticus]
MSAQLDPLSAAADLLYTVKTGGDPTELRDHLANLDQESLAGILADRPHRLAFWLNVFNAYVHLLLEEYDGEIDDGRLARLRFYSRNQIPIAGTTLSLTDVRDGLLRRSKLRWGFGYLPRPFPARFERRFRLESCDPRVHFALDRSGDHAPPVSVYSPTDVDHELDVATEWYLSETVSYDEDRTTVKIPHLFRWYRGDFGGMSGIRDFLATYDVVPAERSFSIEFVEFDSIDVDRYRA